MPPSPSQPSEIAREVLRLIAARRVPPTPDNFRKLYHEVAGTKDESGAVAENFLKSVARSIPRDTAERTRLGRQIDQSAATGDIPSGLAALEDFISSQSNERSQAWNELIANLLRQWEARQIGWTTARKRDSLDRVLAASDAGTLYARLHGLVRSWAQAPGDPEAPTARETPQVAHDTGDGTASSAASLTAGAEPRLIGAGEAGEILGQLRELLLFTLNSIVPAFLAEHPELSRETAAFATAITHAETAEALRTQGLRLRKFAYRLEMAAGDTAEVNAGLLNLLRLLLENIDQIVVDDRWLRGQIEVLRDLVSKPANVRLIDDAERRLREVIFKQSQLKHNLTEAQKSLKEMLAGFVDHLAHFSEATGAYHERMGACAEKISAAGDITEISGVLAEVLSQTAAIREETRRSRDELAATRNRAVEAEARIAEMQRQLDEASYLMRHDQLTGAMNRRGLEEAFTKEAARARRYGRALSVALLDLDNFKRLNDTFGHKTGDEALMHLATIVRQNLRPQDTLARHGGEEFVLLYPDTPLEHAQQAVVRLQRELTRNFFLAEDKKILITFSAGVAEWNPAETIEAVLQRADGAMYQAKQTGKNKVIVA